MNSIFNILREREREINAQVFPLFLLFLSLFFFLSCILCGVVGGRDSLVCRCRVRGEKRKRACAYGQLRGADSAMHCPFSFLSLDLWSCLETSI